MEYVLQTNSITKRFGSKAAVSNVSLNVMKGDIYGFIGRNGAGKTTLIRIASGLAKPDEGTIRLFESEQLEKQRRRTGTMIENPAVFPNLTARQNLQYYCLLLGLDKDSTIDDMLTLVGLKDTGKKKAKNFSLGMKQRLAIAVALLDQPEFLMLDEPINGLDPTGIKEIRELVLKLNKERNITILISSHILGELSKIATRYGVINNGVMVDEFTNEDLQKRCTAELEIRVDNIDKATQLLKNNLNISNYSITSDNVIRIPCESEMTGIINKELAQNDVTVMSSMIVGQDLEDYFMQLMERTAKE